MMWSHSISFYLVYMSHLSQDFINLNLIKVVRVLKWKRYLSPHHGAMFFRKPPICHHSSQIPHRCHFGDCPPCGLICGKQLDGCKHSCPVRCHSAVKTIIRDKVSTRHGKPVLLIDRLFLVLIHFLVFWFSWAGCESGPLGSPTDGEGGDRL